MNYLMYKADFTLLPSIIDEYDRQKKADYLTEVINNAESVTMGNVRLSMKDGDRLYRSWTNRLNREINKLVRPEVKQRTVWDNVESMANKKKSFVIN